MKNDQRPDICLSFLGWQCRVRQYAVRQQGGVPPRGVQASVRLGDRFAGQINTVLNKLDPEKVTAEFRFMVQKTNESQKVYENALKFLSEYYFQYPAEFDDRLAALFALDSELAQRLVSAGQCELGFFQGNQKYNLVCDVVDSDAASPEYQATYWHNHLFNPNLPGVVRVLSFTPQWENCSAETT
jgi:hypothetical protein